MKLTHTPLLAIALFLGASPSIADLPVGAAPEGDARAVASRIIKYNFPNCRRVTSAVRVSDGSIRATCDGTEYMVFTVFNAKEGKVVEVALNCAASRALLGVPCAK